MIHVMIYQEVLKIKDQASLRTERRRQRTPKLERLVVSARHHGRAVWVEGDRADVITVRPLHLGDASERRG